MTVLRSSGSSALQPMVDIENEYIYTFFPCESQDTTKNTYICIGKFEYVTRGILFRSAHIYYYYLYCYNIRTLVCMRCCVSCSVPFCNSKLLFSCNFVHFPPLSQPSSSCRRRMKKKMRKTLLASFIYISVLLYVWVLANDVFDFSIKKYKWLFLNE